MASFELDEFTPLFDQLSAHGVELDQRLAWAISQSAAKNRDAYLIMDDLVLESLLQVVPEFARYFPGLIVPELDASWIHPVRSPDGAASAHLDHQLWRVMNRALERTGNGNTLTTNDFVKALAVQCIESTSFARPLSADRLMSFYLGQRASHMSRDFILDLKPSQGGGVYGKQLDSVPQARKVLEALAKCGDAPDDFELIIAEERGGFRPSIVSVVDDFAEVLDSGIVIPRRLLAVSGGSDFAGFTTDAIDELADLMNDRSTREQQLQAYFERHPHFFRKWDAREIYPQVYLKRGRNPLIPDFILVDNETQRSLILDLKLPKPRLVVGNDNRKRFASAVLEARSQLMRYRDWFRNDANRESFYRLTGSMVYEPQLCVVIGRLSSFKTSMERQAIRAENPDLEVVTYDEMLMFAKRRICT